MRPRWWRSRWIRAGARIHELRCDPRDPFAVFADLLCVLFGDARGDVGSGLEPTGSATPAPMSPSRGPIEHCVRERGARRRRQLVEVPEVGMTAAERATAL